MPCEIIVDFCRPSLVKGTGASILSYPWSIATIDICVLHMFKYFHPGLFAFLSCCYKACIKKRQKMANTINPSSAPSCNDGPYDLLANS